MPRATVIDSTEKFELTTLPDAYVVVRRMTYGEKLNRQDAMMDVAAGGKGDEMKINIMAKKVALQDFANLIVEHNLTDDKDLPLNFKNPNDVMKLDPRIGDEVGSFIDRVNSFEDVEVKNF